MHDGMAKVISSIGLAAWPDVEDPGLLNIFLLLPDSTIMKRQSNCHTIAKKKRNRPRCSSPICQSPFTVA
jgi:hypothetical protein